MIRVERGRIVNRSRISTCDRHDGARFVAGDSRTFLGVSVKFGRPILVDPSTIEGSATDSTSVRASTGFASPNASFFDAEHPEGAFLLANTSRCEFVGAIHRWARGESLVITFDDCQKASRL